MMKPEDIVKACSEAGEPGLAHMLIDAGATQADVTARLENAADIRATARIARNLLPDLQDIAIDELVLANIPAAQARERLLDTVLEAHEDGPEICNKHTPSEPAPSMSWDRVIEKQFGSK